MLSAFQLVNLLFVLAYYGLHGVVAYRRVGKSRRPLPAASAIITTLCMLTLTLSVNPHNGYNFIPLVLGAVLMVLFMAMQLSHHFDDGPYYSTRLFGGGSVLVAAAICCVTTYAYLT